MQSFLKQLSLEREKLSPLEKQVLDYILENPEQVGLATLSDLSTELFVSTATISRTCKQLGYQGFQDLKYSLNKYTTKTNNPVLPPTSNQLVTHIERIKDEFDETLKLINESEIQQAASYIKNSKYVEFFGVGASYPICVEAARKLLFSGSMCTAREDWDTLYSIARNLTSEDLAILVSFSGETSRILEFASLLKKNKVKTIAIIGRKSSSLESLVDLTVAAHVTNLYYGDLDLSSRFPLTIILDLIILTYINDV